MEWVGLIGGTLIGSMFLLVGIRETLFYKSETLASWTWSSITAIAFLSFFSPRDTESATIGIQSLTLFVLAIFFEWYRRYRRNSEYVRPRIKWVTVLASIWALGMAILIIGDNI